MVGDSLLVYCGEMIPKLKSRTEKTQKPLGAEQPTGQSGGKKKNKKK